MKITGKYAAVALFTLICILFCACAEKSDRTATTAATAQRLTEAVATEAKTEEPQTDPAATEKQTETANATDAPTEPRTEAPTEAPTEPVTETPTTEFPQTEIPTTEPPATEPPTTETPISEPPQTDPPQTEPPHTDAPATEPPETDPPETDPPKILVTSVAISAPSDTLQVGKTMKLTAAVKPTDADDQSVTWSISSGSSCAKISSDGTLTGVKAGKCTVKATANDGSKKSAAKDITITEPSDFEGSGTKSDPYLIKTADDLKNIAKYISKKGLYFKQTADIDLSKYTPWTPLGYDGKEFEHNYDGGGYKITNLTLRGGEFNTGLFGETNQAVLKNVVIENVACTDELGSTSGGLVGAAYMTSISGCTVSGELTGGGHLGMLAGGVYGTFTGSFSVTDCHASGKLHASSSSVGGLIGEIGEGPFSYEGEDDYKRVGTDIIGCSADVGIDGGMSDVGGLVGYYYGGMIKQCRASGDILTSNGFCRGGLVGQVYNYAEICECYATGNITSTGSGYGAAQCGGLIGKAFSRCKIHDCYATGDIECASTWSDCQDHSTYDGGLWYNYRIPCGSLIGMLQVISADEKINVYNCYATGTVSVPNACEEELIYCKGSLIGLVYDTASIKLIKDEYRVRSSRDWNETYYRDITADMMNGSMIERLENNYCVSEFRDYYTPQNYIVRNKNQTERVGQYKSLPTYKTVNNITADAVKEQSTFAGFDFSSVWKMTDKGPALRSVK